VKTYPPQRDINENRYIRLPHTAIVHRRPVWELYAACRGAGPEMFHDAKRTADCLAVCHRCPVIEECRSMADDVEKYEQDLHCVVGIYGGETPKQRIERRRNVNQTG
jgi:hypothetical protein